MREPRVTVAIPTYNRSAFLREAISGVLAQTYGNFRLLVCDNASEDDTSEMVAAFGDPRIEYVRSEQNIGMIPNFRRTVELSRTEYVVLLADDDLLYPDHLRRSVEVLDGHANVGAVHSAFDLIDQSSDVALAGIQLVPGDGPVVFETGDEYLARSMRDSWTLCWSSVLFRREAVVEADGLREREEPMSDFPFLLRVACRWDFACITATLAATRKHADAATASYGEYDEGGYHLLDTQPQILHQHRLRVLEEMELPEKQARALRRVAETTLCRDKMRALANRAGRGMSWGAATKAFGSLVRDDPRTLLFPVTGRFVLAQAGGRTAQRAVKGLRSSNGSRRD